jgi:hypothetical protein
LPEFLRVLPSDIARADFDGACLLALSWFWTNDDSPKLNGVHYQGDDGVWWVKASYRQIAEHLGVDHQAIGRLVRRLETAGLVHTQQFPDDNRKKLYRRPC